MSIVPAPPQRHLAALWFADIVGYTTLAARDEAAALESVERLQTLTREVAAECSGRVVKGIGDAMLVAFSSTEAAVRSALQLRQRFDAGGRAPVRLRIGVHVGDMVQAPDGDLYGDGVNVAARLQQEGGPGEILVSGDVWRQLRQLPQYRFTPRGERRLRGHDQATEVFLVDEAGAAPRPARRLRHLTRPRAALAGGAVLALAVAGALIFLVRNGDEVAEPAAAAVEPEREVAQASIAVLPFENMSADPDNAYFADGLAEEILNALADVPGLQVAARTSSFSFKDRDADIPTIAEALGVRTVLEGSVRKSGERVRITAQLVNAEDGLHLWSETYDRDLDDIFAVQEEIARAIVGALEVRLTTGAPLVERPTESREAYEEYLRGLFLWNRRTVESLQASVGHFERAVDLDPEFAIAWAGLADAHLTLQWYLLESDWEDLLERGREAAERALAIDPNLAQAHVSLGVYEASRFRWAAADSAFRRGLDLDPRYATGHYFYGHTIGPQGRLDEAIEHARVSVELDPLSLVHLRMYGIELMWAGRYDESLAQFDRVRELDPNFVPIWMQYAKNHVVNGRWEEATAALVRRAELVGGDPEVARRVVASMERHARDGRPVPIPSNLGSSLAVAARTEAAFATMLGQRDTAMTILERMYEDGDPNLREAVVDPWLAPLHSDPRFVALMARIGLRPVAASRAWMEER
jgi:adenylate cyclase